MSTIWKKLSKPINCLAPMEAVTDSIFRQVIIKCGKPDLMFTEFANVDGLNSIGKNRVGKRLDFLPDEKPLIAQIWGEHPENFYQTAKELGKLGFDGIDINMGCPDKNVVKKGLCSALVHNREHAKSIIQATKKGAGKLPVSVKIRIGFSKPVTVDWTSFILNQGIDALIVHGRTTKQMSKVPNNWSEIAKAVEVRNKLSPDTLIIGNGDVMSLHDAQEKVRLYGVDGVMIGRGIFHNPWLFNQHRSIESISIQERLDMLKYHTQLFEAAGEEGIHRPFLTLRRFFKIYIQGFIGAKELRIKLMETNNPQEVYELIQAYSHSLTQ